MWSKKHALKVKSYKFDSLTLAIGLHFPQSNSICGTGDHPTLIEVPILIQ